MLLAFGNSAHVGVGNLVRQVEGDDYMLDFHESEIIDQCSRWGEEYESGEFPDWSESDDGGKLEKTLKLKHDGRSNYSKFASKAIDTKRYYVFVSPMHNHVQIRWEKSEQRNYMARYRKAIETTKIIRRCRELRASRASKVSHHTLGECRKRAEEWHQRHSGNTNSSGP